MIFCSSSGRSPPPSSAQAGMRRPGRPRCIVSRRKASLATARKSGLATAGKGSVAGIAPPLAIRSVARHAESAVQRPAIFREFTFAETCHLQPIARPKSFGKRLAAAQREHVEVQRVRSAPMSIPWPASSNRPRSSLERENARSASWPACVRPARVRSPSDARLSCRTESGPDHRLLPLLESCGNRDSRANERAPSLRSTAVIRRV